MASPDAFDTLGIEPRFDLDQDAVRRAWLRRSAALHPDRLAADSSADDEAAREAALLNQARRTLEDAERRANALLARLGGPSKEQDRTLPPTLLAEVLEVREEMAAARAAGAPLDRFHAWAQGRRAEHIARVGELFAAAPARRDNDLLRAIRLELNAWRYVERMIEQLDPDDDAGREASM